MTPNWHHCKERGKKHKFPCCHISPLLIPESCYTKTVISVVSVAAALTQTVTVFTDITILVLVAPRCGFTERGAPSIPVQRQPRTSLPSTGSALLPVGVTQQQITRKERGGSTLLMKPPPSCHNTPTLRDSHVPVILSATLHIHTSGPHAVLMKLIVA